MIDALKASGPRSRPQPPSGPIVAWPVIWILLGIVAIVAPLMGCLAYLTLWECKLLGFMQIRFGQPRGPHRVCCSLWLTA